MKTVLSLIWFVLAGVWLALGYAVGGVVAYLLIVTIPFGIASFRVAGYALWPFGRTVVNKPTAGVGSFLGNVRSERVAELGEFMGSVIAGIYEGIRNGDYDSPSEFQAAAGRPHQSWTAYFGDIKSAHLSSPATPRPSR